MTEPRVGYGSPPLGSKFRKGASGNPKGRPKGVRNLKSDLADELAEFVTVREGNASAQLTKQRALIRKLIDNAVAGDIKSAAAVITLCGRFQTEEQESEGVSEPDRQILDRLVADEIARRTHTPEPAGNEEDEAHA